MERRAISSPRNGSRSGVAVADHLLANTSPSNLTGDYLWEQAAIAVDV